MQDFHASFRLWFDYDIYANQKVLSVLENNLGQLPDDALKLFSHIIAAHHIWNHRIANTQRSLKVWERIALEDCGRWLQENLQQTQGIIEKMEESGIVEYENTAGGKFSNNIPDIFFHVLTHSHYHRGQIARALREAGIDPPETNYIVYRR